MKASLFSNTLRNGGTATITPLDTLVAGIQGELNTQGHSFASKSVARSAVSLESMDAGAALEVERSVSSLSVALESIVASHGNGFAKLTQSQRNAGVAAAIITGDIPAFLHAPLARNVVATESVSFINAQGGDYSNERMRQALEAYDEKENKNAIVYSVAYNMQAARQDEFGETFFPTVVVTPDQVGFSVSIRLISVYDEVRRQITGNLDTFNKRNIIQAVIDPSILKNDMMKIVPVYRTVSAQHFVDPTLIVPVDVVVEGTTITTSPLAMGKKFSLLAISQTDALLETGLQDTTDSIDTAVTLAATYMKLVDGAGNAEVVKFNTARLPTAVMTYAIQGNFRLMNLAFTSDSLMVNKNTTDLGGVVSTILAPVVAGGYTVRLGCAVSGSVNLELADTNMFSSEISVVSVIDVDGNQLSLTSGAGAAIAALFVGATMVGYDLDARRTNVNRRMRGQLLDTTFYNQVYAVPLRSPITVPRPLTIGDANDSTDLAALITATHIRTSNAAVEELLKVEQYLAEYVATKTVLGTPAPEILGVSRFLVQPFYEHAILNVNTQIDSIKSHERAQDIQAVMVNKLRDMAYRMYRDSGYKAASDALAGGQSAVPTIIIGTDPVLSRYLTVSGDFRTLGNDFNVKIVSTLNMTMAGKIVMTFGVFDSGMEGVPNPMHFGNMAWKPELTLVLPLHRNGANSKELTVQPSFLHITNLPIMSSLTVLGISDIVAAKNTTNMHSVP
jgi:hypothetical protein